MSQKYFKDEPVHFEMTEASIFFCLLWILKAHERVHKSPSLYHILSQFNPYINIFLYDAL
jgi:hypothetical protein